MGRGPPAGGRWVWRGPPASRRYAAPRQPPSCASGMAPSFPLKPFSYSRPIGHMLADDARISLHLPSLCPHAAGGVVPAPYRRGSRKEGGRSVNLVNFRATRSLPRVPGRPQNQANQATGSRTPRLANHAAHSKSVARMGAFLLRCCAILAALFLAVPASAHPVPFSYLDLDVRDTGIEGTVTVHLVDIAPVLGVANPADLRSHALLRARRPEIERYLASRIALEPRGFDRVQWGEMAIVDEGQGLAL